MAVTLHTASKGIGRPAQAQNLRIIAHCLGNFLTFVTYHAFNRQIRVEMMDALPRLSAESAGYYQQLLQGIENEKSHLFLDLDFSFSFGVWN